VINNRTFSETTSLRYYARGLICIILKIKENMLAVLRVDVSVAELGGKKKLQ
jgi:hypothetical protein